MSAANDEKRIGVTVLSGFLGSGKTTFMNRLLREPAYADAVVIVNEFGEQPVDHYLVRAVESRIVVLAGGCICCTVSGELVAALRELFMLALRRRIKPFKHVLIETTGLANPAPILFALRHAHFLAERYVYRGALVVADVRHIARQLLEQPEAAQQLALADAVVFSKLDLADPRQLAVAQAALATVNPGAARCAVLQDEALPTAWLEALGAVRSPRYADGLDGWLGAFAPAAAIPRHSLVSSFCVDLPAELERSVFSAAISALLEQYGQAVLRLKGLVFFAGQAQPWAVHGVHQELYPLEPLAQCALQQRQGRLVFIVRGADAQGLEQAMREALHLL